MKTAPPIPTPAYADVHEGIVALVQHARNAAARSVNALMTSTYWEIGDASSRPSNGASDVRTMATR